MRFYKCKYPLKSEIDLDYIKDYFIIEIQMLLHELISQNIKLRKSIRLEIENSNKNSLISLE